MFNWIKSEDQEFPTNKQNFANFENTRNNAYIGVIVEECRNKRVENVVPLQLWLNEFACYYWTAYGETEKVKPIKWCLMPKN